MAATRSFFLSEQCQLLQAPALLRLDGGAWFTWFTCPVQLAAAIRSNLISGSFAKNLGLAQFMGGLHHSALELACPAVVNCERAAPFSPRPNIA